MEPALTNIGIVLPEPGFLEAVREACTRARRAADHRRDAHAQRGPGRLHGRVGARAGRGHARQVDRRRRADRRVRGHGRAGRADRGAGGRRLRGHGRGRRHARRQRALARGRARHAARGAHRRGLRADGPLRERFVEGVEAALAEHGMPWIDRLARRPLRVPLHSRAAAHRRGVGGRRRSGARGVPSSLPDEPRRADHALPQHGADVPGDDRGAGGPPHRGIRRGRGRAAPRELLRAHRRAAARGGVAQLRGPRARVQRRSSCAPQR